MRALLTFIVVVVVAAVLGLGYLGFIPVVAGVFGSDKPRDLGVKTAATDLQAGYAKFGVKLEALPANTLPQESLKYSGQKPVDTSFTGAELSSVINNAKWKYYPVSNVQIKINPDNTGEVSGLLRLDRIQGYATATGVSQEVVATAMDRLKLVPNSNPPFYLKGTTSVDNGKVSLDVQQLEVGRFSVPSNWVSDNKGAIVSHVEDRIRKVPGLSVKSFSLSNGAIKFSGTVPEVQSSAQD